jgi:hypothetical protein
VSTNLGGRARTVIPPTTGAVGTFSLLNLEGGEDFYFQFFPQKVDTEGQTNWQQAQTTIGMTPITYANREPRRLRVDQLYFDSTDSNTSLTPLIKALYKLLEELPDKARPPVLLAAWGDRQERGVLVRVKVTEEFFKVSGEPIRAAVAIEMWEIQAEGEATSAAEVDDDDAGTTRPRRVNGAGKATQATGKSKPKVTKHKNNTGGRSKH